MDKILINIKDKSKTHIVISLLKELSFIEFRELGKASKTGKASDFRELFGIWKGRKVTLGDLRQKAWQRKTL
jgi:cell division inhibitor SulA